MVNPASPKHCTAFEYLNKHTHDDAEVRFKMIREVLAGLEYLHAQDPPVVHGWLSMGKLFVDSGGNTRIGEFGIAALTRRFALHAPSISQAGGSRWMAPELMKPDSGDDPLNCTTSSDIWALGCTLFEITSGKLPYSQFKHELRVRMEVVQRTPPAAKQPLVNPKLDIIWQILNWCWEFDPQSRPPIIDLRKSFPMFAAASAALSASPIMGSSGWKETPDIAPAPGKMVWDTRIPSQPPPIQKSASDSESWAIQTARAKKLRTEEKDKAKVGACKHCKRLKVKCTFEPPGAATCQCCRSSGQECIVEGRKPRKNSEPLEQLASQIDDKQEIIDGLLKIISRPRGPENAQPSSSAAETAEVWKWIERAARSLMAPPTGEEPDNAEEERLPVDSAPFGLLAELSLDEPEGEDKSTGKAPTKPGTSQADGDDAEVGVASAAYFRPGPMAHPELRRIIVERQMVPEILTLGVVSDEDVEHLFRIFHERIDAVIAIIDPVIHTVAGVKARCPFLFTVICAIAARYWIERPELYSTLMHHARSAAAMAITDGWKSLEVCQAYLLLSVYPQPARSWAEDRSWLYLGCAIRLAMDLNLYKQGTRTFVNEAHEREMLNRTRTWLICFNMDRALATKLGRPTTIPEDYIVQHSREWWRRSKFNGRLDVHLCYYTQLLRTVTRYFSLIYSDPESLSGFNESTEFGPITRAFDDEMEQFRQDAEHAYSTAPESRHPASLYQLALMPLAVAYYRLVMYSFGLEHAHKSAAEPGNMFLTRSIDTASEVLRITNEDLPIWEFHRYSPDGHWMWSVFAAAFLIKLAKPRAPQPPHLTMSESQRESSLLLVRQFITTLERSAVDVRHSPALYARFLRRTLGEPVAPSQNTPSSPPASTGAPKARVTFSPGPSEQGSGEDVLAAMYSLTGEFWDNALLPGTWGIPGTGRGM